MATNPRAKKSLFQKVGIAFSVLLVLIFATPVQSFSATPSKAKVLDVQGEARFLRSGTSEWLPLTLDTVLTEGDSVKTSKNSKVKLELSGNSKTADMIVKEDSEFNFKTFHYEVPSRVENTLLDVAIGGILVKAEKLADDSKFEVNTPTSIVGIRGTTFEVQVSKAA